MRSVPDVILLCGGAGLRLRSVIGDAPKGMAAIGNRPFLEILLKQLSRHGFERVVLGVGYQKDVIQAHFGTRIHGLELRYSPEETPLGTGGALRYAADLTESECVVAMNGDSYTDADLNEFLADYRAAQLDVSVLVVPADGRDDCGLVQVDSSGQLAGFAEKQITARSHYVNAGVYVLSRRLLYEIPQEREISLEKELFPQWLAEGRAIRAFAWPGRCIDIGTPERYWRAQDLLGEIESGVGVPQGQAQ